MTSCGFDTVDPLLKIQDGIAESIDDGFALAGDALPGQSLCFRLGFCLSHQSDFVSFGTRFRGNPFAARGVDVVDLCFHERQFEVQARSSATMEFSEALDN